ncbi:MAG: 1,2-phenylacetyl-CoA epoxidase subunit B [Bacteroidetes bacterium]|jgi:ring-1,2-phenylacetyl-CoA epoxidase subunit PaaB|nr:1,2-phenylacetyl-CoA epoxidase subunit B [Bacteroidota bacterium]
MTDTQWSTWEVFHQTKRGDPHEHVGSVHAPDPQMALQLARDQFARRLKCSSLWVVRTSDIVMTDYQDPTFFAQTTDKSYRDPKAFDAPEKRHP